MNLQAEVLGLSVAYALLGTLVLLGVARSGWPWAFKAGAIVLTSAFYVFVFFRTQGLLGWSAATALPARFEVLWVRTVEPDPASNDPGAIHLWLEALDADNRPSGEPQAFRLPYSTKLARKAETARVEIQAGHAQGGGPFNLGTGEGELPNGTAGAAGAGAEPGGDPSGGGALDPAFLGGDSRSVLFAPLPAPVLPPKGAQ
jgi:hypothetical protein